MVLPDDVIPWSAPSDLQDFRESDFDIVAARAGDTDVILFGVGEKMQSLPLALKNNLAQRGLRADIMDTGAACRTYNVLLAEGRRVMALLLPVEKKS